MKEQLARCVEDLKAFEDAVADRKLKMLALEEENADLREQLRILKGNGGAP